MKKMFTLAVLTSLVCLNFTGCAAAKDYLLIQTRVAEPFSAPAVTNAATGEVTPAQTVIVTNTVYAPAPAIQTALATAHQYTPMLPSPYNVPVDAALGFLSVLLGLYARVMNGKLTKSNAIVNAVIAGVEVVGHPETKAAIQNSAAAAGVQTQLDPLVQNVGQAMK